jgi:hypothetical protein
METLEDNPKDIDTAISSRASWIFFVIIGGAFFLMSAFEIYRNWRSLASVRRPRAGIPDGAYSLEGHMRGRQWCTRVTNADRAASGPVDEEESLPAYSRPPSYITVEGRSWYGQR